VPAVSSLRQIFDQFGPTHLLPACLIVTHSGRGSALAGVTQLSRTTPHGGVRMQDPRGTGHKKKRPVGVSGRALVFALL
jgi:hypothetical protein